MSEYLFQLEKNETEIGYLKIDRGIYYATNLEKANWRAIRHIDVPTYNLIIQCIAHPFVFKDKHGNNIFEDNKVDCGGYKAIVKQNDGDFGYHLEFIDLAPMEPIKTGKKLTNILYRETCKDIELIKERKARKHDITLVHGDLAFCEVCKAGEGELTTECCGRPMTEEERNRVYKVGDLDFINGKWTKKRK